MMQVFRSLLTRNLLALLLAFFFIISVQAQSTPGLLLIIGGGYTDTYNGFMQYAIANARNGLVKILVLPVPYATNAETITQAERNQNLKDAEERRLQIEGACLRNVPADTSCEVVLVPLFTRSDASDPAILELFSHDVAAIYILGGDQAVAMQALIDTPAEQRLTELYANGTIIGGTSAGGAVQSRTMLAAYRPNFAPENALFFGAVEVWNTDERRGLPFGIQDAIVDQHFQQRARMGRLISVITQPDLPHVGIGVDAYTGVVADGNWIRDVFGLYTVTVLDAETYHAADSVRYVTIADGQPPLISVRNVLLTVLSPGDFSYNLQTRVPYFGQTAYEPPPILERTFDSLRIPSGAGTLILAGDISDTLNNNGILRRFLDITGKANASILVVADGGASPAANQRTAQRYANALSALGAQVTVGDGEAVPDNIDGIVFVGRDASNMTPPAWLRSAWLTGTPVLADNAAATLLGSFYAAHGPTPTGDAEQEEIAVQRSFVQGKTEIKEGLNLLPVTLQPQVLADKRFGRLFSLAYNHPDQLAIALNANTALEVHAEGARVLGENGIFVLDLRFAERTLGTNNGFVIANGLLDVFAPGEIVQPEPADIDAVYQPQPTPQLPTLTPTPLPTSTAAPTLTVVNPTVPTATTFASSPDAETEATPPAQPPYWLVAVLGLAVLLAVWFATKARR
ncbi:MAG TPA: cyanophycinase [Chloroflexus aurantiacus]|jgi:cyanophycinase|uniref:Cyanophycinase and related exopeptidase-like protein n=1 Tax=Chloroflexus aurantiacus (strain ATCC 29366 / DSM 635 / J-10-fl) TaxID=324602 RepID=A9WKA5_CHLAA|nr:Type 1 glutamine amidotransferase-like domain-containing protein [Chloroflexus aurantiacus]ABY35983.1 Cyanophycinase and related exopeptidase-like protein [Chloroflexus aurantiacus J-10-fl]GIV91501.1 MAG: cyanophycinase [Chloroflexus sp.]HBW68027.1 cyanophycinase [Chloroflexus aurantiacus]